MRGTQQDPYQYDPLGLGGGRLAEGLAALEGSARGERLLNELAAFVEWSESVSVARPSPDLISPSIPVTSEIVRFTDRYMRAGHAELSAYDASEGALHVLFALISVLHPRAPRFFAIENIGHALHPRLARGLVARLGELAIAEKRQIIVTTHSPRRVGRQKLRPAPRCPVQQSAWTALAHGLRRRPGIWILDRRECDSMEA